MRLNQQMAPSMLFNGGRSGPQNAPTMFGGSSNKMAAAPSLEAASVGHPVGPGSSKKAMAPSLEDSKDHHSVGQGKAGSPIIAQQAAPSSLLDLILPPTQQQLVTKTGDGGTLINQDTTLYKLSLV